VVSVAIVGSASTLAQALADSIRAQGVRVVTIGGGPAAADHDGSHLPCDVSSARAIADCLHVAEKIVGEPPAVVRLGIAPAQSVGAALASLALDEWIERAEAPLRAAFAFHQAAQRFFADRSGRILIVIPTVGLSGGPGYAPLATTCEADRSLVKAQARVSGHHGLTINCLAVASTLLTGNTSDPDRSGLPRLALPAPDLTQVADVMITVLGRGFDGITGQTIAVDGGRWMAP
jgi:3-oxoacyl-[acyl-carrier protein] reductase